jgi:hypothetical protein
MCLGLPGPYSFADTSRATLESKLQTIADNYIANTAPGERATAISISVSLPDDAGTVDVASGKVSNKPDAADVTPDTLFQIGSITKSFTSVTLLQLQSDGVLDLDDTLGIWLPEYPTWKQVTLRQLLNMTSGIPSYDDIDAMLESIATIGLSRRFSPEVLVGFADPSYPGAPPTTTGYAYSNTNYMLAGMVIERATGKSVRENFEERFFGPRYGHGARLVAWRASMRLRILFPIYERMYEVEMIDLSIKLPTQLAEQSQVVAKKLGITRSELIRRALSHEIEEAEAGIERRSMAQSLVAMQADASEVEANEALDHAFDEPLPVEDDGWWRG